MEHLRWVFEIFSPDACLILPNLSVKLISSRNLSDIIRIVVPPLHFFYECDGIVYNLEFFSGLDIIWNSKCCLEKWYMYIYLIKNSYDSSYTDVSITMRRIFVGLSRLFNVRICEYFWMVCKTCNSYVMV